MRLILTLNIYAKDWEQQLQFKENIFSEDLTISKEKMKELFDIIKERLLK